MLDDICCVRQPTGQLFDTSVDSMSEMSVHNSNIPVSGLGDVVKVVGVGLTFLVNVRGNASWSVNDQLGMIEKVDLVHR